MLGTGYTGRVDLALHDEPEAVSREVQDELTARAQRRAHEVEREGWAARRADIQRSIDWLQSQRFRRDVRSNVRAMQRQLDQLDKRLASN